MPDAPREDLIRMETGTLEYRAADDGGESLGTLFGYAAVFDDWTEIHSWEGDFKERIVGGAFRKTLRERREQVKVLFNHGMDPQIGDKPLGKPRTMKEDQRGLFVEVPLDDTSYNKDIRALLASGALDGMSIRMSVVEEGWEFPEKGLPERTIRSLKLYELGPVTFPAYSATQAGVRAHAPRAFEAWRRMEGAPVVPDVAADRGHDDEDTAPDGGTPPEDRTEDLPGPADTATLDHPPVDDIVDPDPAPTDGHAAPEPEAPARGSRLTRERRELTLAYLGERLDFEAVRTDQKQRLVDDYEAAIGEGGTP